jgi:homogentisate 1,2-dioxygenase
MLFHYPRTAALDFVVFPPRWLVAENTFKPPYYHRNCMSEFMGNICGAYDAKGKGFAPGCSSLHSTMTPHGPDAESYENFVRSEQKPYKVPDDNYAFMFESGHMLKTTKWAMNEFLTVDEDYAESWSKLSEIKYEKEEKK